MEADVVQKGFLFLFPFPPWFSAFGEGMFLGGQRRGLCATLLRVHTFGPARTIILIVRGIPAVQCAAHPSKQSFVLTRSRREGPLLVGSLAGGLVYVLPLPEAVSTGCTHKARFVLVVAYA